MDSVRLVEMLNAMRDRVRDIESLLRIRNGRLLLEAHRYPYHPDTLHSIMFCTKSVTSAMIGIAIGQGTIRGTSQRVSEFFPECDNKHISAEKRNITLENLLTMSGGFEWPGGMLEMPTARDLPQSPNWVKLVLDKPLRDAPGTRFVYNTGSSHLLSAIL